MIADTIRKYFNAAKPVEFKWQPARRPYVRNKQVEEVVFETGYHVAGRLEPETLARLKALYANTHNFKIPNGGMFYSLYSRDIFYRKKVHRELGEILQPVYDSLFTNYRCVLHSFIVKVSGPESEFCLHQDSTSIDEMQHSNLSVWIPLQDTDMNNGCLCVVPYSHRMFSPYRGISFPQPFEKIEPVVRKYLQPLPLKAGDILLFDNRLVHNSGINASGTDRAVVMSGIYPAGVPIMSCYKDENRTDGALELIEQNDDYLLTYENFLHDCRCRPETGKHAAFVTWDISQTTQQDFLKMCKHFGLQETNIPELLVAAEIQKGLDTPVSQ
jgi:hypothetical protein